MLRIRTIVILVLLIAFLYYLAPRERKRRWLDKLRELAKALALAILIYWIYMFLLFYFDRP